METGECGKFTVETSFFLKKNRAKPMRNMRLKRIFFASISPKSIKTVFWGIIFFLPYQTFGADDAQIAIKFENKNLIPKMELYEVREDTLDTVARTKVVHDFKQLPLGKKINETIKITPGKARTFALVMSNTTDKNVYFFATPHIPHPPDASIGYFFECLCNNHVYKITPKSVWYRVVRLEINKSFSPKKSEITHTLVGVPESDVGTKYKKVIFNEE